MDDELVREIERVMSNWDYTNESIVDATKWISGHLDAFEGNMHHYIVLNASESAPNKYDEDALELQYLFEDKLVIFVYTGERDRNSISTVPTEAIQAIDIEDTGQRVEVRARIGVGNVIGATYDETRFKDMYNYYHKIVELI